MYAKQVSRLYEPIEPISLPWELRSLVSDLTIQNGTRSARAIVRRRTCKLKYGRLKSEHPTQEAALTVARELK